MVDRGEREAGDYWDVLTAAEDDSLSEDSYEFATLPDGDLIVDEKCDETLASLADAVEEELQPPYRAVAVKQGAGLVSLGSTHPNGAARAHRWRPIDPDQ